MEQYIPKSAIVAEIERRIKEIEKIGTYLSPKGVLTNLLCHLNTFKVKEVDLDKEIELWYKESAKNNRFDVNEFAKHFFELGIKTTQKGE